MQLLTDQEADAWARAAGAAPDALLSPAGRGAGRPVRVHVPGEAHGAVGLAYALVTTRIPNHDEARFPGALLWLLRWEIWSESIDGAGYVLLDALRGYANRETAIGESPGHLFGPGSFAAAHACLSLPMLFRWDALYLTPDAALAAFISHEGYVDLTCRDERMHQDCLERFRAWQAVEI